ncbi:MAG: PilN domain-containing protein [Deltaproteobacteria bacterium]|nr:PilN domain-containing protein [Deltaproteobacteria bacterium]
MNLTTFAQRIRRADFLDGLGIYVEPEQVSLAHVSKRLLRVALRHERSYPLAPASRRPERAHTLTQAVSAFIHEFKIAPGGVHLCLARQELLLNRLVLPAAARENLRQVLEYEIERVIPLPRNEVFWDYQVRESGGGEAGRLAVLIVSVPRRVVTEYVDALEAAGARPKAVVIAAAALGDYAAFCRGTLEAPLAMVVQSGVDLEVALFAERQLVASHALRGGVVPSPGELQQIVRRDLAEVFHPSQVAVEMLYATAANGGGSEHGEGSGELIALASGRLDAPLEFFSRPEPGLLPAVGAALGAVRESVVDVNLLPEEHRPGLQEGLFVPIVLLVAALVLALVYGGAVIVRDEMTRRTLAPEVETLEPQVAAVKKQEAEARALQARIDTLTADQSRRMIMFLKELTDRLPTDAYLTTFRYRNTRLEIEGFANRASELIQVLENSSMFRNVQFTSPTTAGQAGEERFSIVMEIEE